MRVELAGSTIHCCVLETDAGIRQLDDLSPLIARLLLLHGPGRGCAKAILPPADRL